MVNKAVVGVIGVILIATLGVGALVGLQGGGDTPAEAGTPTDNGGNGGATGNTTNGTAAPNGTMTNGSTATATATPAPDEYETSLSRSEFTAREIEQNITRQINEWRAAEGLDRLTTGPGSTKETLHRMAKEHSNAMAAEGVVAHTIGNDTTRKRYERHEVYTTCSFKRPGEDTIARPGAPDVQVFEWIGGHETTPTFSQEEGIRFHENESAVAGQIVDRWRDNESLQYGLLSSNYRKTGVGVNVTRDGTVYATIHLCGK